MKAKKSWREKLLDKNPYWRTLKTGGQLNEKYPGGVPALRKRLEAEGHKIIKKGKRHVVADYEKALVDL